MKFRWSSSHSCVALTLKKSAYIIQSLYKYFSGGKYASYEEQMQDIIRIEGRKVGRKYFSVFFHVAARESLINAIKFPGRV